MKRLQKKQKETLMPLSQQLKDVSKWNNPLIRSVAQMQQQ
jgi:hypothetical protein